MPGPWLLTWLARLELTAFSTAVREIWWVFPAVLVIHSLSMAMAAGFGTVVTVRALGFIPELAMSSLRRFRLLLWLGLIAATASGLLLLVAYPAKALTNPLFYLKLLILAGSVLLCLRFLQAGRTADIPLWMAVTGIAGWFTVIFAGRFLAYTHSVLMASWLVSPAGG